MIAMAPVVPYPRPLVWPGSEPITPRRSPRARPSRGLVVDLDDTLYPRRRYLQSGFAAVAAHAGRVHGVPADDAFTVLTEAASRGAADRAFQHLCACFGLSESIIGELVGVFRAHRPNLFLGTGARTMLRSLRADHWRVVVLTNGLPSVQARKVDALGLSSLVDAVVYAEETVPGGKPHRAAFMSALQAIGTRPEHSVMLGDDLRCDVAGGRAAGLATIRLALSGADASEGAEADAVVEMLNAVPRVAASLLEGVTRHVA
jgi:putative hydrolase of the HAD superfamily